MSDYKAYNEFLCFTIPEIKMDLPKNDEEKPKKSKNLRFPKGWTSFTRDELTNNKKVNKLHRAVCVQTGAINGITVFDFDSEKLYEKVIERAPELKGAYTVKTPNGYHVYFKYNPEYRTSTNTKAKIDIRNDKACAFGAGTIRNDGEQYILHHAGNLEMEAPAWLYTLQQNDATNAEYQDEIVARGAPEPVPEPNIMGPPQPHPELAIANRIPTHYIDNYEDWTHIVWAMRNSGFSEQEAKQISAKSAKYDDDGFALVWNSPSPDSYTAATLQWYANNATVTPRPPPPAEENDSFDWSEAYARISQKYGHFESWGGNDQDCAKIVLETNNDLVFAEDEFLVWRNNKWIRSDPVIDDYAQVTLLQLGAIRLQQEPKDQDVHKCLSWLQRHSTGSAIGRTIRAKMMMGSYDVTFDAKPYLLGFANGVLDIKTNTFREMRRGDLISMSTGYDWRKPTQEEHDCIKKIFETAHTDPAVRASVVSVLYNGLTGVCPEKFVIWQGGGRNCKGLTGDLMIAALGDYGYKGNAATITNPVRSGPNPEVANMDRKRYVKFAEPSDKINAQTVCDLTGGGTINARKCHSNKPEARLDCIIVLEANRVYEMDGVTSAAMDAVVERTIYQEFGSKFTAKSPEEVSIEKRKFMPNPEFKLKSWMQQHRNALIDYILTYTNNYNIDITKIYVPKEVENKGKKYCRKSDQIQNFMDTMFEEGGLTETGKEEDYVQISELYIEYKRTETWVEMSKVNRRKCNAAFFKDEVGKKFPDQYRARAPNSGPRNVLVGVSLPLL